MLLAFVVLDFVLQFLHGLFELTLVRAHALNPAGVIPYDIFMQYLTYRHYFSIDAVLFEVFINPKVNHYFLNSIHPLVKDMLHFKHFSEATFP